VAEAAENVDDVSMRFSWHSHGASTDEREVEGWKMADLTNFLDKAYEGKDFAELAESPVDALQGLSKADAEALEKALGIKTVHDLATNKFVLWAQAINVLGHKH
jgi:hypothetical protein